MADEENHIEKTKFKTPFVCGARNLGEALRRISEGAAMIRTKVKQQISICFEALFLRASIKCYCYLHLLRRYSNSKLMQNFNTKKSDTLCIVSMEQILDI